MKKQYEGEQMNIIVVGCGKIGTAILSSLVAEGHNVVAVDTSPQVIDEITTIYDAMGVCSNGADCETLKEAGVESAHLVIATTNSDEVNMISCFMAKSLGAEHTICRIRNPEYNDKSLGYMRQTLGISLALNPELLTAKSLYSLLKLPSALKVDTFSARNFEMVEFKLKKDSVLDGLSLIDLRKKLNVTVLICIVKRDEEVFIPHGNFVLKGGDKIGVTASLSEMQKFIKKANLTQKQAKNVMIVGASKTSFYLAKLLISEGSNVKIIDLDEERCLKFSQELPEAIVINGDGARQELLLEEGVVLNDAFVCLTGTDEENILLSYFAASQNVSKVIPKVNHEEFVHIAENLGLDCLISPTKITCDRIVSYARALENSMGSKVETLYKLMDGKAELLEFIIQSDCPISGIPLKNLNLKNNTLIAGIIRGRKIVIPSGEDLLMAGDRVIIVSAVLNMNDITDIVEE